MMLQDCLNVKPVRIANYPQVTSETKQTITTDTVATITPKKKKKSSHRNNLLPSTINK